MRILIDAGHYTSYNQSPVFKSYKEGNMTWSLYKLLRAELEAKGYHVDGTRANQSKDIEVYQRGMCAVGYDLFLSLHSNACGSPGVRRVVVIPPVKGNAECYEMANALGKKVSEVMGIRETYQIYPRPFTDLQGKTRDYYGVVRGAVDAGCPRIMIIEHSFHTNEESARWLYKQDNLAALAKAEAEVIAELMPADEKKTEGPVYRIDEKYTIKANDHYSNGKLVPSSIVGKTFTISRILEGRILLSEINSWVTV